MYDVTYYLLDFFISICICLSNFRFFWSGLRWAVDRIIMIIYCVQGIELFQKLCKGLEYMVAKDMGKSS